MNRNRTQYDRIINYLNSGKSLTSRRALGWGVTNLRARVCELRGRGFAIATVTTWNGKTAYAIKS